MWYESFKIFNEIELFDKCNQNMESTYLSYCIQIYKVYCDQSKEEEINFAGRKITFNEDKITIQMGSEDDEGTYYIDMIKIQKTDLLEIINFFDKSSNIYIRNLLER